MKNGKKPNKREKILIESKGLKPDEWLIYKKVAKKLHLVHRGTGATRVIGN
ncbi:hypothetical protein M3644_26770 [Bacillus cereus]|uniref:DUF6906 family protein n=1 Tax=Bacillus cereus TaxID=1396 RepID=UPI00203C0174|nr:hypothetical protein [Bacillus cereus]MCM3223358.1 hypothetical protein [Bacillus cereus]